MHPPYDEFKRYEGTSQYIYKFDVICSSKQLQKKHKRCKYETKNEIAAPTERDYIVLGRKYDMNDILEDIDMFDQPSVLMSIFIANKIQRILK